MISGRLPLATIVISRRKERDFWNQTVPGLVVVMTNRLSFDGLNASGFQSGFIFFPFAGNF